MCCNTVARQRVLYLVPPHDLFWCHDQLSAILSQNAAITLAAPLSASNHSVYLPHSNVAMEDINLPQQSALLPALLLIGVISFASAALGSTHLYLIEQYICHQHYKVYDPRTLQDGGLVDEALCKFPEIQSKVAKISGIYQFLCFVPGD